MSQKILKYATYIIIIWLLVEVNCQIQIARHDHTATVIDNKLYILGGTTDGNGNINITAKEFICIDVSIAFDTQKLSWQNLSSVNRVPSHEGAASVNGGKNNDTLFIYGGRPVDNSVMESLVYTFNPQNNSWSTPKIVEGTANRKFGLTGVIDNGKMYLWGGMTDKGYVNDMLILDTINLSWKIGNSVGAPTSRINYGATLLPNHKIIYMGGNNDVSDKLPLNEVYIYDLIKDSWNTQITSGDIPSDRNGFSVVLGLDGQRIIIFGGLAVNTTDALYVLDLIKFKWYIPKFPGKIPGSRYFHKANVIGNYMVISFGTNNIQLTESDDDILLFDISNNEEYMWTTNFKPVYNRQALIPSHKPPNRLPIGVIVAIVFVICLIALAVFIYLKRADLQAFCINLKRKYLPALSNYLRQKSKTGQKQTIVPQQEVQVQMEEQIPSPDIQSKTN